MSMLYSTRYCIASAILPPDRCSWTYRQSKVIIAAEPMDANGSESHRVSKKYYEDADGIPSLAHHVYVSYGLWSREWNWL